MAVVWITETNLGSFATDHLFNLDPVVIQFTADPYSTVSFVSGALPLGISWESHSNYIQLKGLPAPIVGKNQTFSFTFRVSEINGTSSDKFFTIELLSAPIPQWGTPGNLGSYLESYSFNVNPLYIQYDADRSATVSLINGSLPTGLTWEVVNNSIKITSSASNVSNATLYEWTFRVTNPNGVISDRTFNMTITPVTELPYWGNQKTQLGYIGNNQIVNFEVKATLSTADTITYSFIDEVDSRLSINGTTGTIICNNTNGINTQDTDLYFTVRATSTSGSYSDKPLIITLLTVPHTPVWITSTDLLTVLQGTYLTFPLEAYYPSTEKVMFMISPSTTNNPFLLDSDGLLYGEVPLINSDTVYYITIIAYVVLSESEIYASDQTFTIKVVKSATSDILVWNNPVNEIVNVGDGTRAVFDLSAKSSRSRTIKHSVAGGQCPPGMMLDKIQGRLVGYVDYHCTDKDYYFDVLATDGVDTIIRTVHMQVNARFGYQFSEINIPLSGDIKQRWLSTNNFVFTNGDISPNASVTGNTLFQPSMSLIRGINSTIEKPESIIQKVFPSLERLTLSVGAPNVATVNSNLDVLLYRDIIDSQNGAAYEIPYFDSGTMFRPANLENIRKAFIDTCKFANSGLGSGTVTTVFIDANIGSITRVDIIKSGSGYINHPSVKAIGSGSGAEFNTHLTFIGLTIVDPGSLWKVGDHYLLEIGSYSKPAEFVVTDITSSGGLRSIAIVDGGSYSETPVTKIWIKNSEGALASVNPDFGISQVDVINGGSGYVLESTSISFSGSEILPSWQSEWKPLIPLVLSTPSFANTVVNNSELAITKLLDGVYWQINDLEWTTEGLFWQGTTSFLDDDFSFDGNSTRFLETLEPRQTLFDINTLTFDLNNTTYDVGSSIRADARINWGRTLIDDGTTAFEFYSTIFDADKAPTESSTIVKRLITLQDFPQTYIPPAPTPTGPTGVTGPTGPTAPTGPETYWMGQFDAQSNTIIQTSSAIDISGGIIVATLSDNIKSSISKVNRAGYKDYNKTLQWDDGIHSNVNIEISSITTDPSNSIYIAVNEQNPTMSSISASILKVDSTFDVKWQLCVNLLKIDDIAVLTDGSLIVISRFNRDATSNLNILKISPSGSLIWGFKLKDILYTSCQITRVLSGFAVIASYNSYVDVFKFNSNGDIEWQTRLSDDIYYNVSTVGISADASGNIYCNICTEYFQLINSVICKINSIGAVIWQKIFNPMTTPEGDYYFKAFSVSADYLGNPYITGKIIDPNSGVNDSRSLIIKFDTVGDMLWQNELRHIDYDNDIGSVRIQAPKSSWPDKSSLYFSGIVSRYHDTNANNILIAKVPYDGSRHGTYNVVVYTSNTFTTSDGFLFPSSETANIIITTNTVTDSNIVIQTDNLSWIVNQM